jgi:hypothetical protein
VRATQHTQILRIVHTAERERIDVVDVEVESCRATTPVRGDEGALFPVA